MATPAVTDHPDPDAIEREDADADVADDCIVPLEALRSAVAGADGAVEFSGALSEDGEDADVSDGEYDAADAWAAVTCDGIDAHTRRPCQLQEGHQAACRSAWMPRRILALDARPSSATHGDYLVQWVGWDLAYCTWCPATDVEDSRLEEAWQAAGAPAVRS